LSGCVPEDAKLKFSGGNITLDLGMWAVDRYLVKAQSFVRWLTLGNQLGADQIYEDDVAERIKAR
jgi:hypothetical protein